MVARVDDAGCVSQAGGLERSQHLADVLVEEAAQTEIPGLRPLHHVRRCEELVIGKGLAVALDIGMQRFVPALAEFRQWQYLVVVAIEMLCRRGRRKMQESESQEHD